MDIKRCFEILELHPDASIDEVRQAYKDMVNIWHPDRFSNNPRLEQKAEKKLKEINQAYETLSSFLPSKPGLKKEAENPPRAQPQAKTQSEQGTQATASWSKTKTEAAVETGTSAFLDLWSYLSTKLRQLIAEQVESFKEESQVEPRDMNQRQGRGRGKDGGVGRSRGRGQGMMGRGGGGGGRGRGSGGGRGRSR